MKRILMFISCIVLSGSQMALGEIDDRAAVNLTTVAGSTTITYTSYCMGWEFEVNSPIRVTALGYFDLNKNGLSTTHPIGIYNSSGSLLVSAVVPDGAEGELNGWFRYTDDITPINLVVGQRYTIAAVSFSGLDSDAYVYDTPTGLAIDSAITFISDRRTAAAASTLTLPTWTNGLGEKRYFGPNFEFCDINIPEPATLSILILGGVSLCVRRR